MNENSFENKPEQREQIKVEVKVATQDDWETYRNIRADALKNDPGAFDSKLGQDKLALGPDDLLRDDKFFVLAKVDSSPTGVKGMAGAVKEKEGVWRLVAVYTRSDFRGQGISTKVITEVLSEISYRNPDLKEVKVTLNVRNNKAQESAIGLYKKLGFSKESFSVLKTPAPVELEKFGVGSFVMVKTLNPINR